MRQRFLPSAHYFLRHYYLKYDAERFRARRGKHLLYVGVGLVGGFCNFYYLFTFDRRRLYCVVGA